MSKNEALEKWLDAELPVASFKCRMAVCAAWRASAKHTLSFVAEELRRRGQEDYAEFVMKLTNDT